MSKFKDATGEAWRLKLTLGSIRKVQEDTEINIGLWLDNDMEIGRQVLTDPLKMFLVLNSLCEEQCKERDISEQDFADRLHGDSVGDAREALWQAFLDFCPSQQRKILETLQAKTDTIRDKMLEEIMDSDGSDLISFPKHTNARESAESPPRSAQPAS